MRSFLQRESQFGQHQRDDYPQERVAYKQHQDPSVANSPFTEPQNSHGLVQNVPPRVQEGAAQCWENPQAREGHHQLPPTSQAQLPAENRMGTGPPIRASDPGKHNMDPRYQGGQQNQQRINDPHQPMYASNQYQQGGQQNQPLNQWQGEYHPNQKGGYDPNQQGGYDQDPRQNQQLQQGYAQGGPSFNHHGQQHHPLPRSPNYQPLPRRNSKNLPNSQRLKQNSNVQENILLQGIHRDIKDAAKFVIHEGDELESMAPDAPFDPNLICPLCMRNFRVGEIQKYKKHVDTCQGQ